MGEDLYAVLGVAPDADPAVVRAAYLALVRMHHPDGAIDPEARLRAEQKTKSINAAYSTLGEPKQRAAYDERRRRPQLDPASSRPTPAGGGARPGFKGKPAQRKGPSLQARRERLSRVKLVSIMLTALAVVLLFGAFTGIVGILRPDLPAWLDPKPMSAQSADAERLTELTEAPADVMLPWPQSSEARPRSMAADGLGVTFLSTEVGDAPVLEVTDTRGSTITINGAVALSTDRDNFFGVGRLEGSAKPAVLIVATPASDSCCLDVRVVFRGRSGLEVANLGEAPSDIAERFPADLNEDGTREWVLPDRRFVASFGSSSPPPPVVYRFANGAFHDVSTSGEFGEVFANHLAPAQRLCTLGSSGACAAFVASAARLGRAEWAWDLMLRNYDRDAVHEAGAACAEPTDPETCPSGRVESFPARLRRFLVSSGYVRSGAGLREDVTAS